MTAGVDTSLTRLTPTRSLSGCRDDLPRHHSWLDRPAKSSLPWYPAGRTRESRLGAKRTPKCVLDRFRAHHPRLHRSGSRQLPLNLSARGERHDGPGRQLHTRTEVMRRNRSQRAGTKHDRGSETARKAEPRPPQRASGTPCCAGSRRYLRAERWSLDTRSTLGVTAIRCSTRPSMLVDVPPACKMTLRIRPVCRASSPDTSR